MAAQLADRARSRLRWLAVCLAAALISPSALAAKPTKAAKNTNSTADNIPADAVYCCKDASGQRTCSDKLPHACYNRAYIIMKQGIVLHSVEAPLTAAQRRQRAAEAAARKKEEQERRMQEWKDRSLLETYPKPSDLDAAERAELDKIDVQLEEARKRKTLLAAQITAYDQDVAAGRKPDVSTRVSVEAARGEVLRLEKTIALHEADRQNVWREFAEKRAHYLELLDRLEKERAQRKALEEQGY
ncbi:MAG: hypothetical protein J5820_05580 [Rhodocyclaceae bacterium]|nr:hypothetical protein [Rhodocyclaceae bacterium]